MRRWLKMTRTFLGCLFHVKGYSWYAPWLRELMSDGNAIKAEPYKGGDAE